MKFAKFLVLAVLLAGLLSTQSPGEALAQSESKKAGDEEILGEMSAEDVGERASELLTRIQNAIGQAETYRDKMTAASAEDSIVLRIQLSALELRVMEDVHELAGSLVELEKEGPQPGLRSRVEEAYVAVTPRIWEYINRLRGEIDTIRARRLSTPAEERPALEDQVTKLTEQLNAIYEVGRTHLQKMEELGLDITQDRAYFAEALLERADELSGRLALDMERIGDLEARAKDTPDDANVPVLLVAAQKSLDNNAAGMEVVCDLMDTYELDSAEYRAQLVMATSDITTGITDAGVVVTLLSRAVDRFVGWISENGPGFVIKLLLFTGVLIAFYFVTRVLRKALEKALESSKLNVSLFRPAS